MEASQSQRSQSNSRRPLPTQSRRETIANKERRLQLILDKKKALDIQQKELNKQYQELNEAEHDLLSQRGSASRSEHCDRRDDRHLERCGGEARDRVKKPVHSKSTWTADFRKRARSPSKRDRGDRRSHESHTGEFSPKKASDKYYGSKKVRFSPFSKDLEEAKIDRSHKVPTLEMYDGTGDPHDHTYSFEQAMHFHGHDAVAMCHLFLSTLKKTAREWVISLPSRSVKSWEELRDQFHTRFGSNKRRARMMTSLLQVKQRPDETLRQYMKRFRDVVSEILTIDSAQVIQFLTMGLNVDKSSRLIEEIISKTPQTLAEAYEKADKFIELEEALTNLRGSSRFDDNYHRRRDLRGNIADKRDDDRRDSMGDLRQEDDNFTENNSEPIDMLAEETEEQSSDSRSLLYLYPPKKISI